MAYELKLIDHKVKFSEDGMRQMDVYEIGHYTVKRAVWEYESGKLMINFSVYCDDRMMPEIEYWTDWLDKSDPKFKIQTAAYGALGIEEIQKVIDGYNEAVEVVKVLTETFLGKDYQKVAELS